MIPIRDDNPQVDTPIATYTLIGLNKERYFEDLDIIANIIGSIVGALAFTFIKK